jgi:hypothetical protein
MLGGYPTAEREGILVPSRDTIYQRISSLPEGTIFRREDIISGDDSLIEDFDLLRGYDYFHVGGGNLIGIIETESLRCLPELGAFVRSYEMKNQSRLIETGDWTALRLGMKRWEPIRGRRYYTTGKNKELLSYGRYMKIEIIPGDSWLFDESEAATIARAVYDTFQDKESEIEIIDWTKGKSNSFDLLKSASGYLNKLDQNQEESSDNPCDRNTSFFECASFLNDLIDGK